MRKLTLDLDALEVQSFATDAAVRAFGTVNARQKGNTGPQDTECSAVDACPSGRGCSDFAECPRTQGDNCPSAALDCETARGCTKGPQCDSAVDACPSQRGCTDIGCPVEA